jgi:hypothetical protein
MPRVKVTIPDPLLQVAADAAQKAGKKIDDLYEAGIAEFIEANRTTTPGSMRSRGGMPASSPKLTIEIPEELFQEAEKLAKRLGKRRDVIYALGLAKHVKYDANANVDDNHGHGDSSELPTGRWQSSESAES